MYYLASVSIGLILLFACHVFVLHLRSDMLRLAKAIVEMCDPPLPPQKYSRVKNGDQPAIVEVFPEKPDNAALQYAWSTLRHYDFRLIDANYLKVCCRNVFPVKNFHWLDNDIKGWELALQEMRKVGVTSSRQLYDLFVDRLDKILEKDRKLVMQSDCPVHTIGAYILQKRQGYYTQIGLFYSIIKNHVN